MPLTLADVRNKQFTTVRLRPGYDEDEVDSFLDEVEANLIRLLDENQALRTTLSAVPGGSVAGVSRSTTRDFLSQQNQERPDSPSPSPWSTLLTPVDVRNKQFSTVRRRPAYDEQEVDQFLDEVEAELDRLIQENEELRAKLAEVLLGGVGVSRPAPASLNAPNAEPLPELMAEEPPRNAYAAFQAPPRPENTRPRPPRRWLEADVPASIPLDTEVSLLVRVSRYASDWGGERVALRDFTVGPAGARIEIIVQAGRGLAPGSPLEQTIVVPAIGDSAPARFTFRAKKPGLHMIRVTAFAGGTFLGELAAELSAAEGGPFVTAATKTAELAPVRAQPGEVTLQVRFDGERYSFQLLSESYLFEPVIAQAMSARPGEAVERAGTTLRAIASATSGYTEKNARTWMEETGAGLWNNMVPDLIKEQFWQIRPSISAFSIATGNDTVPWELLYPLAPGYDQGFLIEQFPVLRRVYGQRRSRHISVGPPMYVVPPGGPSNADQEISSLRNRLGLSRWGMKVQDLAILLHAISAGDVGLLHFACHNTFRSDGGGSSIQMEGGRFVPELLNRAAITRPLAVLSPIVFLNACRSAGAIPEYTRLMGWAQQFMGAGAGAFVGTLWAVRSDSASTFAEAFYDALLTGQHLGQATLMARAAIAADTSDPTWLAYAVYGDPSATT